MITAQGSVSYQYSGPCGSFNILFTPGEVTLFGPDIGHQRFTCPTIPPHQLLGVFPSRGDLQRAALLHYEGTVSKPLFLQSLDRFLADARISKQDFEFLQDFIHKCVCPNAAILKRKLAYQGYKNLAFDADFVLSDPLPEFARTVEAMWCFMEEANQLGGNYELCDDP